MPVNPAGSKRAIFRQVCELIPTHLVPKLARKHGIEARTITPWSHTVSMLYAQFTHAIGLNDVCDALRSNRPKKSHSKAALTSACLSPLSTSSSLSTSNTKTPSPLTICCCCVGYWLPGGISQENRLELSACWPGEDFKRRDWTGRKGFPSSASDSPARGVFWRR